MWWGKGIGGKTIGNKGGAAAASNAKKKKQKKGIPNRFLPCKRAVLKGKGDRPGEGEKEKHFYARDKSSAVR